MKKFLMVIAVILISAVSFGQSYDVIKEQRRYGYEKTVIRTEYKDGVIVRWYDKYDVYHIDTVYADLGTVVNHYEMMRNIKVKNYTMGKFKRVVYGYDYSKPYYIPPYIEKDYDLGNNVFNCGSVFISIGSALLVPGLIIYGVGLKKQDVTMVKTGTILSSVGGASISVSIPMLCFGDNIKRRANLVYRNYLNLK